MLKTARKIITALIILTVITIIILILITINKTFYNDEDVTGNTQGNIYNGGLISEIDGQIYFSNHNDGGSLYVMNSDFSDYKKLHKDKAVFINVDDDYVYYVRANHTRANQQGSVFMFNNTGIYRINRNGKNTKVISSNPGCYLSLSGNYLYYQDYNINNGLYLYRQKIDMTEERIIEEDAGIPIGVIEDKFYFTGFTLNHDINTWDLGSFTINSVYQGNYAYPIFHGDYIYYMDLSDKYSIGRMDLDGSNKVTIVDERCSTYNITNSGRYLYYQVDDQENNRIARMNLDNMEEEVIIEGNYKQIHVTNNYVFFKDFEEANTFYIQADAPLSLNTFDPPIDSQ